MMESLAAHVALDRPRVAVLIPCFNEEAAIANVVLAFREHLPESEIYVYDNNSTDGTSRAARDAGARVRNEIQQGKGHVVRRMFADVDADVYVLVDGDDTYDASAAPRMVEMLTSESLDMVTAGRVSDAQAAWRRGHRFGNVMLTGLVRKIFGARIGDMLSGYRVSSRRFVKSFPALSGGFETETQLTVHALELNMPIGEVMTSYKERPAGSSSKLRTYRDGFRILRTILLLTKEEKPLQFFSSIALLLAVLGVAISIPIVLEYFESGLVPRLPTVVLSMGLVLLSFLSLVCGLVLDSVARGRKELKRLAYLTHSAAGRRRS